jgi:hypothetical protein
MQQLRRLFVTLLATGIALVPGSARPAPTGRVEGRVLNAATGEPVPGVEVTLTSAATGSTDTLERRLRTDERGHYRFDDLPTGEERFYALDAVFQGGLFSGRAITLPSDTQREPVIDTTLRVWPTTTDPEVMLIERDDIFVSRNDEDGGIGVVESVRVVNTSERAYIGRGGSGDAARPGETPSVGFALPSGADNTGVAVIDADIDIPALVGTEYGFAITTAVPPGETRVTFSYPLRGTAGSYDLSRRALYPILSLSIYATDPFEVSSNRLSFDDEVTVGDKRYERFASDDPLDAGDSLQAIAVADAGTPPGLLTGMAGVLALVVVLGLLPLLRSRRAERKPPRTRAELVEAIARLDLENEQGHLATDRWASRRAELKAELAARDDRPQEPSVPR